MALPENASPAAPGAAPTIPASALSELRHLHAVQPVEDADVPLAPEPTEVSVDHGDPDRSAAAQWLREAFVPGSGLFTDRQPSIAETLRRAKRGAQVADGGLLRRAATAHGYVAATNKAVATTWVWIVDHPARLTVALTLLALAVAWPPSRQLLAWLLAPIAWAHQALD